MNIKTELNVEEAVALAKNVEAELDKDDDEEVWCNIIKENKEIRGRVSNKILIDY